MNRALATFIHLLMAGIILLGSTGFGLVEHSCQMRGKRISSALVKQTCGGCPTHRVQPSDKPSVHKTDCCEENSRYENVDVTSSLSQLVAKFIKAATEAITAGAATLLTWLVDWLFSREATVALTDSSPPLPLSGRDILVLIQSFLI